MPRPARLPVPVFACGHPARGDDGAGLYAAAELARSLRGLADVRCVGQLEANDLLDLAPGAACLVIDAVRGVAPGSIVVRPLRQLATEAARRHGSSSHTLPVTQTLALALALGRLPEGWFVGIGGSDFETSEGLSAAVRDGMPRFVATCSVLVDALLRRQAAQGRVRRCA